MRPRSGIPLASLLGVVPGALPQDDRPVHGSANACAAGCLHQFATLRDFDRAQSVSYDRPKAVECIADPSSLGLIRSGSGVWMTEAALANRAVTGARLRAAREASS